ncbi:rho GTPase-activating protein 6 [Ischnura elegans]|uniref:rho GTPase-activating protein 6 n=1 Tax=Ischnura elegans TaxID=197161 RepID=UPI001ED88A8C|nr:rho GTPase-activating protein 6 [Ischnura elegans]
MGRKDGKSAGEAHGDDERSRRPASERWLLTRKTWRYMADAGRRLIPEGISGDRPEDIPRIREHFSKMCKKEPRFLLWRKASFPGASPAPRRSTHRGRRKGGGRAGSEEPPALAALIEGAENAATAMGLPGPSATHLVDGRFPPPTAPSSSSSLTPGGSATGLSSPPFGPSDGLMALTHRKTVVDRWVQTEPMPAPLMRRIEEEIAAANAALTSPAPVPKDTTSPPRGKEPTEAAKDADAKGRRGSCPRDDLSPSVGDTIMRYLRMARKKSVDGDKSEKFRTVNYDRVVVKVSDGQGGRPEDDACNSGDPSGQGMQSTQSWLSALKKLGTSGLTTEASLGTPGFEVCGMTEREITVTTFRPPTSPPMSIPAEAAHSSSSPPSSASTAPGSPPPFFSPVTSPPPRGPSTPQPAPSSFLAQLFHSLQHHHRHSAPASPVLSPPGPSSPPPTVGSLPALLPAAAAAAAASGAPPVQAAMQKSKSSSSVVASLAGRGPGGLVSKRIWRPRSRSTQGRTSPTAATPAPASAWIPQGDCRWNCVDTSRQVSLTDTNLLMLTEVERRVLQKVALAKLQALNLGASVRIPTGEEAVAVAKPRRRPYLLRRKARTTTSPLDGGRRSGDSSSGSGLVFGIPISQCIENETGSARSGRDSGGSSSRSSAGSLSESTTTSPPSPRRDSSDERPRESAVEWKWSDGWPGDGATPPRPRVPQVVIACLQHIKEHGLHTLGIFRVGSSKKRVRQLREDLDMGKETDLSASQCPHDVAALLKEYFRDLPEPLLCRDLYPAFVRTQTIRNRRLQFEALQHLVQLLPAEHRDTLCLLLDFLAVVAKHSEDKRDPHSGEWLSGNKMDSGNLATLFAPNILRKSNADFRCDSRDEAAEDRLDVINVVRSMIEHNRELFTVPAELLDEVYVHMMDTHPEALDDLLRSRCSPPTEENWEDHILTDGLELQATVHGTPPRRRVWSREEFLHGTAGMGGPDLGMMPRHRGRDGKGSKKRAKEPSLSDSVVQQQQRASIPGGKGFQELERPRVLSLPTDHRVMGLGPSDFTPTASGGSSSPRDPTATIKESKGVEAEGLESERGVITASLRIPVPAHVALDDIPFIEDGVSELSRGTTPARTSPPSPSNPLPPLDRSPSHSSLQPPSQPPPPPPTASETAPDGGAAPASQPESSTTAAPTPDTVHLERQNDLQSSRMYSAKEEEAAMAEAQKRGAIRSLTTTDLSRRQRVSGRGEAEAAAAAERRYARRRYTDGRHVAAALPEVAATSPRAGPVWKRREIIASEPRRRAAQ